jgi:carbonic anhydrase
MSVVKEYLAINRSYGARFRGPLPVPPSHQVAAVAYLDARLTVCDALGLEEGAAHVIRNAGGVTSDASADARRSMQRIAVSPFIAENEFTNGLVFAGATGLLTEVTR